jgi:hypothetical protein
MAGATAPAVFLGARPSGCEPRRGNAHGEQPWASFFGIGLCRAQEGSRLPRMERSRGVVLQLSGLTTRTRHEKPGSETSGGASAVDMIIDCPSFLFAP